MEARAGCEKGGERVHIPEVGAGRKKAGSRCGAAGAMQACRMIIFLCRFFRELGPFFRTALTRRLGERSCSLDDPEYYA
jgi:hypothetical protein